MGWLAPDVRAVLIQACFKFKCNLFRAVGQSAILNGITACAEWRQRHDGGPLATQRDDMGDAVPSSIPTEEVLRTVGMVPVSMERAQSMARLRKRGDSALDKCWRQFSGALDETRTRISRVEDG